MNGHLPAPLFGPKPRISTNTFVAFLRALDEQGTFEAASMRLGPDGNPQAVIDRSDYLDATELLESIREVVREEIQRAIKKPLDTEP